MTYDNIIIIPYRNRLSHLNYFMKYTRPLIMKYMPNSKIVVVEQMEGQLFNRGKLLNVVFKEFRNKTKYFITNDVDINPSKGIIKKIYNLNNYEIIRIYVGHGRSLGGIVKIQNDTIHNINGFPNDIWGWGIEDRALFYRAKIMKCSISETYNNAGNYHILNHKSSAGVFRDNKKKQSELENAVFNTYSYEKQIEHIFKSGLNNLTYEIVKRKLIYDDVELIKVSI